MVHFEPLVAHLPAWLLVLFRITGIFMFAPLYGSLMVPAQVKVFLALGLSFCVYPMLLFDGTESAAQLEQVIDHGLFLPSLAWRVTAELGIGLVIGYGASLPLVAMQWSGRIIGLQVGIGIAEVFSPSEEQSGILSQLYYWLALVVFLSLGGHHLLLRTLVETFQTIGLGGFSVNQQVMDLIIGLLSAMLHLVVRVSAPLLCLVFLETIAIGFLMKTVPQLNILSVGFAIRILVGTSVLIAAMNAKASVLTESWWHMLSLLSRFFS